LIVYARAAYLTDKATRKVEEAQAMFENIVPVIRDLIVIAYLFVVRIGVPIIITLFIGWWLERKLAEWDAKDLAALEQKRALEQAKTREPETKHNVTPHP
jgi:hypothetical protein